MDIDFTKLDNIKTDTVEAFLSPSNSETHTKHRENSEEPSNRKGEILKAILVLDDIKPIKEQPKRYLSIERDKEYKENIFKAYEEYTKTTKESGKLKIEIIKDVNAGADPYSILLKAIECIGKITGDTLFYTRNKEKLRVIYGALENPQAIEQELREIKGRLKKLNIAYEKEPSKIIKNSIIKNEQNQEELLKKIEIS